MEGQIILQEGNMNRLLSVTFNASGAFHGAKHGDVVVVVDTIDMSTTAEALISAGAVSIFGAAPDQRRIYHANPYNIGYCAGMKGIKENLPILVVSEPRGSDKEKLMKTASVVIRGIQDSGGDIAAFLPNIGASIVDFGVVQDVSRYGFIAVLVTASGGVCFDVAYNNGSPWVLTATTARVFGESGHKMAESAARRIISKALELEANITIVAASSKALEDIHAAQYIASCIIRKGFLDS
jgi:hypothetical protein